MSLRNISIALLLVMSVLIALQYIPGNEPTAEATTDRFGNEKAELEANFKQEQPNVPKTKEPVEKIHIVQDMSDNNDVTLLDILSENPDIEAWVESRGYLPQEYLVEHEYDLALLHAEALDGNMHAQQIMASHLLSQQRFDEAKLLLEKAASLGSSRALLMLAQAEMTQAQNTFPVNESLMERARAWLLVAEKRGDPMGRIALHYFGLTPPEDTQTSLSIQQLSEAYYNKLTKKRLQYGLPEFSDAAFPSEDLIVFQYLEK